MAPRPFVSILIPSYKPRHFEIALTSALAQTWADKEIIVSDDCPTGEIEEICRNYPQVRYSRNPARGPNTNLRRLTELAQGEYLKYLLDDDILHPLCVSRMVEALAADPTLKLAFSARDRIDEDNRIIGRERAVNVAEPERRLDGATLRAHCLINVVNIIGEFTTVMFRKSDVVRPDAPPIYVDYHGAPIQGLTDIATFLQLLERGDAIYFSEPLSLFRIHSQSNTNDRLSAGFRAGVAEWAVFARHVCSDPSFSPAQKRQSLDKTAALLGRVTHLHPDLQHEIDSLRALAEAA